MIQSQRVFLFDLLSLRRSESSPQLNPRSPQTPCSAQTNSPAVQLRIPFCKRFGQVEIRRKDTFAISKSAVEYFTWVNTKTQPPRQGGGRSAGAPGASDGLSSLEENRNRVSVTKTQVWAS